MITDETLKRKSNDDGDSNIGLDNIQPSKKANNSGNGDGKSMMSHMLHESDGSSSPSSVNSVNEFLSAFFDGVVDDVDKDEQESTQMQLLQDTTSKKENADLPSSQSEKKMCLEAHTKASTTPENSSATPSPSRKKVWRLKKPPLQPLPPKPSQIPQDPEPRNKVLEENTTCRKESVPILNNFEMASVLSPTPVKADAPNVPPTPPKAINMPNVPVSPHKLAQIPQTICRMYDKCNKQNVCKYRHSIDFSLVNTERWGQIKFWENVRNDLTKSATFIKDLFDAFPPALVESGNHAVLMEMLSRLHVFTQRSERLAAYRKVLSALLAIPDTDELKFDFNSVTKRILFTYDYMSWIVDLARTTVIEQEDLFTNWSLMKKITTLSKSRINGDDANALLKRAVREHISLPILTDVDCLLNDHIVVDRGNLDVTEMFEFIKKLNTDPEKEDEIVQPPAAINVNSMITIIKTQKFFTELAAFWKEHSAVQHNEIILKTIVAILQGLSKEPLERTITFIVGSVSYCVTCCECDGPLTNLLMAICANVFTLCDTTELAIKTIAMFKDDLGTLCLKPIYNEKYWSIGHFSWMVFRMLIKEGKCEWAYLLITSDKFERPKKSAHPSYTDFCQALRQLFFALHNVNKSSECKDLFVYLYRHGYHLADLRGEQKMEIHYFYALYVVKKIPVWDMCEGDLHVDAKEHLFDFHTCLAFPTIREILILLYRKSPLFEFTRVIELVDYYSLFYRQQEGEIHFNNMMTVAEVQLVVQVYFYKQLEKNASSKQVNVVFDTIVDKTIEKLHVTCNFWDTYASVKDRVDYALTQFPFISTTTIANGCISKKHGKLLMEQLRRAFQLRLFD